MKPDHIITIFAISIGILTPISILYLDRAETFGSFPVFDVSGKLSKSDDTDVSVVFTNIGEGQGRDVTIYVEPKNDVELDERFCLEGLFQIEETKKIFKINFEKMSSNVPCHILLQNVISGNIADVTITADNMPGQHFTISRSLDYIKVSDSSKPYTTSDESFLYIFIIEIILVPIVGIARIIHNRRTRKEYESSEMIFLDKLHKLKREYISIKNIEENTVETVIRKSELQDEIINLERELDYVHGKLFVHYQQWKLRNMFRFTFRITNINRAYRKINLFFDDWKKIEYKINQLTDNTELNINGHSIDEIVMQLNQKNYLTEDFITKYKKAMEHRKRLANGTIELNKFEINVARKELRELQDMLDEFNNST